VVIHIVKFENFMLRMQQLNLRPDKSSVMVKLLDSLPDDYENLHQAWWARKSADTYEFDRNIDIRRKTATTTEKQKEKALADGSNSKQSQGPRKR
jgi:hypothetical protein